MNVSHFTIVGEMMLYDLYLNGCILFANIFFIDLLSGKKEVTSESPFWVKALYGSAYGVVATLLMYYNIKVTDDIFIDLRYVPIIISALYGGAPAALASSFLVAADRILIFGSNPVSLTAGSIALFTGFGSALLSMTRISPRQKWLLMTLIALCTTSVLFSFFVDFRTLLRTSGLLTLSTLVFGFLAHSLTIQLRRTKQLDRLFVKRLKTDFLTGLSNYQGLHLGLRQALAATQRDKRAFALIMAECKEIRTYHLREGCGRTNDFLRSIARGLSESFTDALCLARYESDRFCIVLPVQSREELLHTVEMHLVQNLPRTEKVEFYYSIALIPDEGRTPEQLLEAVENKLFEIKRKEWNEHRERLLRNEKLKAVGELAAAMAHEIRNPLATIKGFLQLANAKFALGQHYDLMMDEIGRMNRLTGEFLQFARTRGLEHQAESLNHLVKSVISLTESEILQLGHTTVWDLEEKEILVMADKDKIIQVLINILKNAMEAIEKNGRVGLKLFQSAGRGIIEISDNGPGIPMDKLTKIFEPFYTTKESGTGLGLAICSNIIHDHHGNIHVTSTVNVGTTFQISLPLVSTP